MSLLLVFGLLILNFGISWFNAWSVGRSWADSKAIGGWPRFMTWCGAIMSASGLTWCYLVILSLVAMTTGCLPMKYVKTALELGYVVIVFPILGSGLAIWIDSVTTAWRNRSILNVGIAGYNTFAMAHNVYDAATTLPGVFGDIWKTFGEGDEDDSSSRYLLLVVLLVLLTLGAGIFTTAAIIRRTARNYAADLMLQHGVSRAVGMRHA